MWCKRRGELVPENDRLSDKEFLVHTQRDSTGGSTGLVAESAISLCLQCR